ncbi:CoA-transferase family III protein [Bordetella bronchiseptica F2]|nr:CaiB/BaiF CoA-transferase family protein [Bordetella bronchiseptica]KDC21603.1 CoA-transferase family III protein [Bordetella bronchiseptica F-1]KDC31484.1 CoA-transferase family III protein [Bordetella bronchiseptica F2]KDD49682.1 CoA-transferase family III protein [Bordetella bronchiseptica MBORD901]QIY01783.1 CoA transferase [Bordetella bronchiseptica]
MSSPNDAAPGGALDGIVVLDLTRILAGPWCTQILADFGARVIKVERPGVGDDTRSWGPPWMPGADGEQARHSTYFAAANRNKQSVSVDIATAEGQEIVRALAMRADVLIENFKVGDLARHGLDYASLSAVNPRLVYCSITGYGQTGPYADRPGYDLIFQGEGGLMSVTGERDDRPGGGPQKVGVAIADIVTGMYASSAVLAALQRRAATGAGQYIDIALLDCMAAFGANLAFNHVATGAVPPRYGNAHPTLVPYEVLAASDGHVIVAAGNDAQWRRFCAALGRPDLAADARYATGSGRIVHRDALMPEIARTFATEPAAHWLARLTEHGIPNGRINDYKQVFEHPQLLHRGMRVEMPDGAGNPVAGVANPVKFSASAVAYRHAAPALGQHTREVLCGLLRMDEARVQALAARGVLTAR